MTFGIYWRALWNDFITEFDDCDYVVKNTQVQSGLSWETVRWAFTTYRAANWHPLTWLSLALDAEIGGVDEKGKLNPLVFHLSSVLLHSANGVLLFLALSKMTGNVWRSGFVAGLFAVHPIHVESVAWISERKDVLSTFFWLLTMLLYRYYAASPSIWRYVAVLATFALGLMAKPMLVSLPIVLLLLDYWPLGRMKLGSGKGREIWRLVLEKLPFFALVVFSSVITFIAQRGGGAVGSLQQFSIGVRAGNAVVSYVKYLWKMVWPSNLAAFYPHPTSSLGWWEIGGAGLILVMISWLVIRHGKRYGYLAVGWLWYVITLIPVIGLVQVGMQAMADRYTYIPLTGPFMIVVWGIAELVVGGSKRRGERSRLLLVGTVGGIVLVVLMVLTWQQIGYWYDSRTLFEHAIQAVPNNYLAHGLLGNWLRVHGNKDEAIKHCRESIRVNPNYVPAQNALGILLADRGAYDESIQHFERALLVSPNSLELHKNVAKAYMKSGRPDGAIRHYKELVKLRPHSAELLSGLANAYWAKRDAENAILYYKKALQKDPTSDGIHNDLGAIYGELGNYEKAVYHLKRSVEIAPGMPQAHANLALALFLRGRYSEAWKEIALCRKYGGKPDARLVEDLSRIMPPPGH